MAKEVGVEVFLVEGYYLPLEQSHPKVGGMLSRVVETEAGGIAPAPRLAPDLADNSVRVAHGMLILALGAQVDHFQLDTGPLVSELDKDFGEIWRRESRDRPFALLAHSSRESSRTGSERDQSVVSGVRSRQGHTPKS